MTAPDLEQKLMNLEDQIAKIIKDEYADEFEDEGRSSAAAHNIVKLVEAMLVAEQREEGK